MWEITKQCCLLATHFSQNLLIATTFLNCTIRLNFSLFNVSLSKGNNLIKKSGGNQAIRVKKKKKVENWQYCGK